jgi:hypothetical protein
MGRSRLKEEKPMTYEHIQQLHPEAFKRYCGVHPETFQAMMAALGAKAQKKRKSGRPSKLSIARSIGALVTTKAFRGDFSTTGIIDSLGIDDQ